ncbi:MAG: NADH-quinone oxidoreductase subunit C [Dehalococcoidales bacterium]|nr:NADH-quinone oxidoreductase subunit C [Dehalococcoidales bacterium]
MVSLSGSDIAAILGKNSVAGIIQVNRDNLVIDSQSLRGIASFLKDTPEFDFDYLSHITVIDYPVSFELVYQLISFRHCQSFILKIRCRDKETPSIPSVVDIWQGADLQEREIFDLAGVVFEGHPNMKRILLWEGFEGYPLRKDFKNDD